MVVGFLHRCAERGDPTYMRLDPVKWERLRRAAREERLGSQGRRTRRADTVEPDPRDARQLHNVDAVSRPASSHHTEAAGAAPKPRQDQDVPLPGRSPSPSIDPVLDRRARELAVAVRSELHREAVRHRTDWFTMRVRWHVAGAGLIEFADQIPVDHDDEAMRGGEVSDILGLYTKIGSSRLVILGEPGSGKTRTASHLAYSILGRYDGSVASDEPGTFGGRVPAIFNLSSFDPTSSLVGWMSTVLARDYLGLKSDAALSLIEGGRVLAIFEGLDEMGDRDADDTTPDAEPNGATGTRTRRLEDALSQLHRFDDPFVLTCRTAAYREAAKGVRVLRRAFAIELKPLSPEAVADYLPSTDNTAIGEKWDSALEYLARDRSESARVVKEALKNPLTLNLASVACGSGEGQGDPELFVRREFDTPSDVQKWLMPVYFQSVFPKPKPGLDRPYRETGAGPAIRRRRDIHFDEREAVRWLRYIAQNLDGGEIKWWNLASKAPPWLTTSIFAVFSALVGAASMLVTFGGYSIFVGALIGGLTGLTYGIFSPGQPPVSFSLREPGSLKNLWCELWKAPVYGLTAAASGWCLVSVVGWLTVWWAGWLMLPLAGLIAGLTSYPLARWLKQAHVKSWREVTAMASISGFFTGFVMGAVAILADAPVGGFIAWLWIGALYGIFLTFAFGPRAHLREGAVATPSMMISSNRWNSLWYMIMNGLAHASVYYFIAGPWTSFVLGTTVAVYIWITDTAWGRWALITRGSLPWTGKLPQQLMTFLDESHRLGVLRQSGAVYMFRHKQLEEYLREPHITPTTGPTGINSTTEPFDGGTPAPSTAATP